VREGDLPLAIPYLVWWMERYSFGFTCPVTRVGGWTVEGQEAGGGGGGLCGVCIGIGVWITMVGIFLYVLSHCNGGIYAVTHENARLFFLSHNPCTYHNARSFWLTTQAGTKSPCVCVCIYVCV
jgi:hypothetical protein